MRIAVPKETRPGETRVALAPESGKKLIQAGYTVAIETGPAALLGAADLVLKVNAPEIGAGGRNEALWMRPGAVFVASIMPQKNLDAVRALAERKVTAFSTDAIPRTTRAQ